MQFRNISIDFATPQIMGILNVTPDSFSDGGRHNTLDSAFDHARRMIDQGARFIDVGGESTRPGAPDVAEAQELDRVIPIVERLQAFKDVIVSVDTSKASVMAAAVSAGARMINDVRALQEPGALEVAVSSKVPVCLMHMQGQPRTMQASPVYSDVVAEVKAFLDERARQCVDAGVSADAILLDPGFGFGKSLDHNYRLLSGLKEIIEVGYPVLVGMSRKSMIGQLLNCSVDKRLAGSVSLATIAALCGAHVLRVHDVQETADAVAIVNKLNAVKE